MIVVGLIGKYIEVAFRCIDRINVIRCMLSVTLSSGIWLPILLLLVSAAGCISEELQLALQNQAVERLLCLGTSAHAVT